MIGLYVKGVLSIPLVNLLHGYNNFNPAIFLATFRRIVCLQGAVLAEAHCRQPFGIYAAGAKQIFRY